MLLIHATTPHFTSTARFMSILLVIWWGSCKSCGIDVFVYLRDVIDRASTHTAKEISQIIPSNWKALHKSLETGELSSIHDRPAFTLQADKLLSVLQVCLVGRLRANVYSPKKIELL